jgi:hypothetical protein
LELTEQIRWLAVKEMTNSLATKAAILLSAGTATTRSAAVWATTSSKATTG